MRLEYMQQLQSRTRRDATQNDTPERRKAAADANGFPGDEAWVQQPGRAPGRRGGSYERIGIRPKYPDARGVGLPVVRLGSCVTGRGIYCPFRQIADKR